MPLHAIEPRRLYRQVADQLRGLIDSGEFRCGDRLPTERERRSSASRGPCRAKPRSRWQVDGRCASASVGHRCARPVPAGHDRAAAARRGPFEILVVRALFEGRSPKSRRREPALPADLEQGSTGDACPDEASSVRHQSIAADRAFHLAVARAPANDAISTVVGDPSDQRMNPYFGASPAILSCGCSGGAAFDEHGAIGDRIASADLPSRARAATQAHLEAS